MPLVFTSQVTARLVMVQAHAEALLAILGREPAAQGIVTAAQAPAAIAALEAAVVEEEAAFARAEAEARAEGRPPPPRPAVWLRQRAWPLIETLRRCAAADVPLLWGV